MQDKERQETIDKVLYVMGSYYDHVLTEDVIEIYQKIWSPYSPHQITKACNDWMGKNRWFPFASEIIKLIDIELGTKGPVPIPMRAQQQWRVILQQIQKHGMYHPPAFSDPITAYLVKYQFSWSYLCTMKEQDNNWEQKRWCEAFALAAELLQDLELIEIPQQVTNLLENIVNDEAPAHSVPLDKISAYRKMLEERANKDTEDLERTNVMIRHGQD